MVASDGLNTQYATIFVHCENYRGVNHVIAPSVSNFGMARHGGPTLDDYLPPDLPFDVFDSWPSLRTDKKVYSALPFLKSIDVVQFEASLNATYAPKFRVSSGSKLFFDTFIAGAWATFKDLRAQAYA